MSSEERDLRVLLKKYEELDFIINKSPVIVFLWKNEAGWPVEFVSENISQFGFSSDEFISGKIQYSDIIYPEDLERVSREVASYSKSEVTEFKQEYRVLNKSKDILWVDDRTFVRRNSEGKITHFQGIILDITDKKRIQEELKNSEQKFRMISEQIFVGLGIIQDGKIEYANQKALEIFGYSLDEMKSWPPGGFARTIHPEDLEKEIQYINQIQNDPTVHEIHFQTRGIKKSGEVFWAEAFFKKFTYKNRPALIGVFIDITERKKAEDALRLTQFSLDHSAEPAMWMKSDGRIIYSNAANCHLLGYSRDELLTMTAMDVNPEFTRENWASHWEEIKRKGSTRAESRIKRKSGEIIPVEIFPNYLEFEGEEYNCAFAHDISERKEFERKLIESEKKYREAFYRENFYKDLFMHDMRNILQSIGNFLEVYEYKMKGETVFSQNKSLFEKIYFQIARGAHLIDNIKKFSELESFEQTLVGIDIYQIIQTNIQNLVKSFKNKSINIQLNPESGVQSNFVVYGNELVSEVIENILLNSIIHNDNEKVQISIRLSRIIKDRKPYIQVEVSDNGKGIEDARKSIIFNRVDNRNKSTTGMGLGLSLVKKILENFAGKIWVEDRILGDYKQGSKFIILLPEGEFK